MAEIGKLVKATRGLSDIPIECDMQSFTDFYFFGLRVSVC